MSLLLWAAGVAARTLSPEEALQRVSNDHISKKAMSALPSEAPRLVNTTVTSEGAPAVYLFVRPDADGYMLVSADDVAAPLLGYSDAPLADGEIPPAMQWWLEQYAREISEGSNGIGPHYVDASKAAGETSSFTPVAPLCKTKWDQDAPYNNKCPLINGRRTYTGCLATALAQVMKYHDWPERGQGKIAYVDKNGTQRSMDFNVEFDWANMLDVYNNSATTVQNDAVALLMKACGYGVRMTYGTSASSASDSEVVNALTKYFNYDAGAQLCKRNYYGLADWQKMIYDNLKNVGPVLYCGSSHLGGHAFVCDGYSTDGYFHFNWGWGGAYDGYFLLTALNPEGEGIGGFSGGYNIFQSIVIGVRKPDGTQVKVPQQLAQASAVSGRVSYNSLMLTGSWFNMSNEGMTFTLGVRVEPVDGTEGNTEYLDCTNFQGTTLSPGYGWSDQMFVFDISSVGVGTYRVSMVTKNTATPLQGWMSIMHPVNMADYVILKKTESGSTVTDIAEGILTVNSAELQTTLYQGCAAKLTMAVSNDSEMEVAQVLAPGLLSGSRLVAAGGGYFFDLMPGESDSQELVFDLAFASDFKVDNTYNMYLYDPETLRVVYAMGPVKVLANPGAPKMSAVSFTLDGDLNNVDCNNMNFHAELKCLSGYFATAPMVMITPLGGGEVVAQGISKTTFFLSNGESAAADINVAFSGGEVGKSYSAILGYMSGYDFVSLRNIDFTVGTAGIESPEIDGQGITIAYDRKCRVATANSASPIADVHVVTAAGTSVNASVEWGGNIATIDFNAVGNGVVIVTVVDESGEMQTVKLAL